MKDEPDSVSKQFLRSFRGRKTAQHQAVWFELCVHQMLVRLGFAVRVGKTRPDFIATSEDSRVLVEATGVMPEADPSVGAQFEKDAEYKMCRLKLGNFWAWVTACEGKLDRFLTVKEITREFSKLFNEYDPDKLQRRLDLYGDGAVPIKTIRFGEWQLTVRLWPVGANSRAESEGRVQPWIERTGVDLDQVRTKIKKKRRDYPETTAPLILAVNVHDLEFDPLESGREILFGSGGTWGPEHAHGSTVTGVIFFRYADPVAVSNTNACLHVNPLVGPSDLPSALMRLPHVYEPSGSNRVEGESLAKILRLE